MSPFYIQDTSIEYKYECHFFTVLCSNLNMVLAKLCLASDYLCSMMCKVTLLNISCKKKHFFLCKHCLQQSSLLMFHHTFEFETSKKLKHEYSLSERTRCRKKDTFYILCLLFFFYRTRIVSCEEFKLNAQNVNYV